jgi:hypothetical protein
MTKFLRLDDKNSELAVRVRQNFWAQFINTGIIILILEANFRFDLLGLVNSNKQGGIIELLGMIIGQKDELKAQYSDYSQKWFD